MYSRKLNVRSMYIHRLIYHHSIIAIDCYVFASDQKPITTTRTSPFMSFTKLIKIIFLLFSFSFVGTCSAVIWVYEKLQSSAKWYLMRCCCLKENTKKCWWWSSQDCVMSGQAAPVTGVVRSLRFSRYGNSDSPYLKQVNNWSARCARLCPFESEMKV